MYSQSSSPSYLLLASLDAARAHAQDESMFSTPLAAAQAIRAELRLLEKVTLLDFHVTGDHSLTKFRHSQSEGFRTIMCMTHKAC